MEAIKLLQHLSYFQINTYFVVLFVIAVFSKSAIHREKRRRRNELVYVELI